MRRASLLWEVYVLRFEEALERYRKRRLTADEAGELLGMSGRHFRRLIVRYEEDGQDGLRDRRLAKPSPRRAPAAELTRMQRLYQERYRDFTVKHFHEQLQKRHDYKLGYTVTRLSLQAAGLVAKSKRGGAHRQKRERRPLPGMLLLQDGSSHHWIPALDRELDLVVTLDDATGEVYSAILVEEEGTASSFLGLAETIAKKGLFRALYTDRGSHYFHTPKAGGRVDKGRLTQVGRALKQLGITHIPSYSPEARGRIERVFGTLQMRLPAELGLAEIATVAAANRYLEEHFVPITMPALRCPPPSRARPSSPTPVRRSKKCYASSRSVRSAVTTACAGTACSCRSRRSRTATTTSRRRCACMNIRMDVSPSSMDPPVWAASIAMASRSMPRGPLNSAQRSGLWICGQRAALPTTPQAQQQQAADK